MNCLIDAVGQRNNWCVFPNPTQNSFLWASRGLHCSYILICSFAQLLSYSNQQKISHLGISNNLYLLQQYKSNWYTIRFCTRFTDEPKKQQQMYSFNWYTQLLKMMWIHKLFITFNPLKWSHSKVNCLVFNPSASSCWAFLQFFTPTENIVSNLICRMSLDKVFFSLHFRLGIASIRKIPYISKPAHTKPNVSESKQYEFLPCRRFGGNSWHYFTH